MTDHTGQTCAAARHCRGWDPLAGEPDRDGRPRGAPAQTDRHALCSTCLGAAEHAIRLLPLDWRDLEQHIPPALGVWADSSGGSPGKGEAPNPPLALSVEALQAGIWRVCTTWEEVAREAAQLSDPPRRRPAPTRQIWACDDAGSIIPTEVTLRREHPSMAAVPYRPGPADVVRAVRILTPRLGLLADQPAVELVDYPLELLVGALERRRGREPDERWDTVRRYRSATYATVPGWLGVLDLAALHRRALAVLGLTRPVRRLPGECSKCGRADLRQDYPRYKGDEQPVYCGTCGQDLPYEVWRRHADLWASLVREVAA